MNAIKVEKLQKNYANFSLKNISFTLPSGTIMGMVGQNGAGKTTILRAILRMINKDEGTVEVLGHADLKSIPSLKEKIGIVMDNEGMPSYLKAPEIGRMMASIYQQWDMELYIRLCNKLKVPMETLFKDLSRGNKMKVMIICALSHHPDLLILDEATSGLDPLVRDEILDLLLEFTRNEEHSVLMSSHIVSDLEKACDYILFIEDGQLIFEEEKDRIYEKYGRVQCTYDQYLALDPASVLGKRENRYGVDVFMERSAVPKELTATTFDLEDLFIYMIKGEEDDERITL